jgi:hypothetical protein
MPACSDINLSSWMRDMASSQCKEARSCKSCSQQRGKAIALTSGLHQKTRELGTLASLHDSRTASPTNLSRQALVPYIICTLATNLCISAQERLKLTQPVLNEVFPHSARSAISHDLKERSAFTPTEAISQQRCLVLWVSALRCFESCHAGVGQLLYGDFWCLEEGGCLGPDSFIEWKRVGKEAIGATAGG